MYFNKYPKILNKSSTTKLISLLHIMEMNIILGIKDWMEILPPEVTIIWADMGIKEEEALALEAESMHLVVILIHKQV